MQSLDYDKVIGYVTDNIVEFHRLRIQTIEKLDLDVLLAKNPYLFRAKHFLKASDLIEGFLAAFLSSSEEKQFGDFLEGLAVFIAEMTCGGHKSTAPGVDLEFQRRDVYYIVSIKSGPRWGNSSQQSKLESDLKTAVARLKQARQKLNIQPVLGICYGKTKTSYTRGYLRVVGQNFWYLISENPNLYKDIIEPIGHLSKENSEKFLAARARVENRLVREFIDRFCDSNGTIDWEKLVQYNSGNLDLDEFLSPGP